MKTAACSILASLSIALASTLIAPASISAQITVNITADAVVAADGLCTLREAITNANGNSETTGGDCAPGIDANDQIHFNISGVGPHTILPSSQLPQITEGVVIDGTTEPDFAGAPVIVIDGTSAGVSASGIVISGSASTIRGLTINNFQFAGVEITGPGATGNTVEGCFLGTDVTGTVAAGPNAGVAILAGATDNLIGGTTAAARNVISGNGNDGIVMFSDGTSNNRVEGNFIGTDPTGTVAVPNSNGVNIRTQAKNNTVGGTAAGAGNVISGNSASGLDIADTGTSGNVVEGNLIGTDVTGTVSLANREGVFLSQGTTDNVIGGTAPGAGNVISGNTGEGVHLQGGGTDYNRIEGNLIGTDITGTVDLGNGGNGIELMFSAADNTIGATTPGAGNIISGNASFGISIQQTFGNTVEGNFIGTDVTGLSDIGNGAAGILLWNAAINNTIGGPASGARNVVSGNDQDGIRIDSDGSTGNTVQGNLVGTDATGTNPMPNATGVRIRDLAAGNTIGGTDPGTGNTIAFNTTAGVVMELGAGTGNAILGNAIFSNGGEVGLGIDLGEDGVTPNDAGDPDSSPNRLQNFPVIQTATVDEATNQVAINYLVDTDPPNATYPIRVEFFVADVNNQEGQVFIGSDSYTSADFTGGPSKSVSFTAAAIVSDQDEILATATDSGDNTSEFSSSQTVELPVELVSLNAVVEENRVRLSWSTASETNNAGFEVQGRCHGSPLNGTWENLGFIEGAGTISEPQSYSFATRDLDSGSWSFRLKQLDFDGGFEFSPVVEVIVGISGTHMLSPAYPNPFNPETSFSLAVATKQVVSVEVFDPTGRRVRSLFQGLLSPNDVKRFRFRAGELAGGVYVIRVSGSSFGDSRIVVLLK